MRAVGQSEDQIAVEQFDIPEMVVRVSAAGLVKTGGQYLLKCSVLNLNDERVRGVQLILLVFDSTGRLKEETSWMERVNLAGYSTKDFSFKVSLRSFIKVGDRAVIVVQQAIGPQSIWIADKVEDIVRAYFLDGQYILPEVRHVHNHIDTPPPLRVIF
jgi:hypothetical protein